VKQSKGTATDHLTSAMFETAHHRTVRNPGLVEISGIEGGKSSGG
jgi:hypothetical protein